jgi:hypothetical protein
MYLTHFYLKYTKISPFPACHRWLGISFTWIPTARKEEVLLAKIQIYMNARASFEKFLINNYKKKD